VQHRFVHDVAVFVGAQCRLILPQTYGISSIGIVDCAGKPSPTQAGHLPHLGHDIPVSTFGRSRIASYSSPGFRFDIFAATMTTTCKWGCAAFQTESDEGGLGPHVASTDLANLPFLNIAICL
jgi:hypothetical protein